MLSRRMLLNHSWSMRVWAVGRATRLGSQSHSYSFLLHVRLRRHTHSGDGALLRRSGSSPHTRASLDPPTTRLRGRDCSCARPSPSLRPANNQDQPSRGREPARCARTARMKDSRTTVRMRPSKSRPSAVEGGVGGTVWLALGCFPVAPLPVRGCLSNLVPLLPAVDQHSQHLERGVVETT